MAWGIPNSGPRTGRSRVSTLLEARQAALRGDEQKGSGAGGGGRARNTVRDKRAQKKNNARNSGTEQFPLRPSDTAAIGTQTAELRYAYGLQRASLKAQAKMVRAMYQNQRFNIGEATRGDISASAGEMADRGLIGSTVHEAARQGALSARDASLQEARLERNQGLFGVAQSRLEAIAALRMGLAGLKAQRAASQQEMALAAFGSGGQNPWSY
jgi:hypothetical protein